MSDLISVILTTYNNPTGLYRSLKSVLRQSYDNIEILVVDGGNNQDIKCTIDSFTDKRIIYINVGNKKSDNRICGNVQYCRNLGIDLSLGKFIAMLDDDDIWDMDKLRSQHSLACISHASLVCCQTVKLSGDSLMIDKPLCNPQFKDLLRSFCYSQTSCYFMNHKDLVKIGGFNENLRSMHEYDIALRMAKKGMRIMTVEQPLVFSYCDNTTKRKYYFIKIAELLDFWKVYGKDISNNLLSNTIKTCALLLLYVLGYIIKDKIWRVIFKLKEKYQNEKQCI